jgi:hypothetical protein
MLKNHAARAAVQPRPSRAGQSDYGLVWDEEAHEEQRRALLARYFQVTRLAARVYANSSLEEEIVRITKDLQELYSNEVAAAEEYDIAKVRLMDLGGKLPAFSHGRLPLDLPNPAEQISRAIHPRV